MIVQFRYKGQSAVVSGLADDRVSLATNQDREAAFFKGALGDPSLLRDAMAALREVVVSDFKYRPRDRVAYKAWLESQEKRFLAGLASRNDQARQKMLALEAERDALDVKRAERMKPFDQARLRYFDWAYTRRWEMAMILDPVVTVHPDEVAFEAFSKDESSYARLAVKYDLFEKIDAFACGTTNIDFSARLGQSFERMRSYRRTRLDIDAEGFTVANLGDEAHREKKIDLPESWVKGFLQVHSTMTLGLSRLRLEPVDLFNILRFLKRKKARSSPRALRFELDPGRPAKVVFEPWDTEMPLTPTNVYEGATKKSVRLWGRDRLGTLARLLPVAQRVDLYVGDSGMPSFWVLDLGEATFTLGLSGWTDNDWTQGAKYELLSRRLEVSPADLTGVYNALSRNRFGTDTALAQEAGCGVQTARSALSYLCQGGRAMYDLAGGVYRQRELFREPFTFTQAVAAVTPPAPAQQDPTARAAQAIFDGGHVLITARRPTQGGHKVSGSVKGGDGVRHRAVIAVNAQGAVSDASCSCPASQKHGLVQGACEHVLALRLAHMTRLEQEDAS